jgi:multidrug/hemolysin transport system ATP-binding protein
MQQVLKLLNENSMEYKQIANRVDVQIPTTMAALPLLEKCKAYISGFEVMNGTMDDAFIAITGKEIRQ